VINIGIHFYEGNFGALFYPVKSSAPFLFQYVNEDEFKKSRAGQIWIALRRIVHSMILTTRLPHLISGNQAPKARHAKA
jgi:hypothetical protein